MHYIAYVDGSYKEVEGVGPIYGGAAIVQAENSYHWTSMTKAGSDELVSMRNVAGEILAAMMLFEHCRQLSDCTELTIYYDYEGIANWLKRDSEPGFWRAKNVYTKAYRAYYWQYIKPRIACTFVHVKGHTGNDGNELVDSLAKKAIADYAEHNTAK